ncbi:unnamed protein product [Ceratitis capitata]|uniref:(Mediterranean fruit fly) hypothetical protein n=1 Tax=Ceratitis capitata TaxID=7213 RepID=A0A811UM94_CERCA|nr:unnamed protein product [Ceratitis capitata]
MRIKAEKDFCGLLWFGRKHVIWEFLKGWDDFIATDSLFIVSANAVAKQLHHNQRATHEKPMQLQHFPPKIVLGERTKLN